MKTFHLVASLALILIALARFSSASPHAEEVKASQTTGGSSAKPTVYVSDFELDVVPANSAAQASPTAPPASSAAAQPDAKKPAEDARKRGSEIVNLMMSSLVAALQKAGYATVRLHSGDTRPDHGVGVRGIFAEVDKENHWRRAVIRTASDSGKMQVIVSVVNLAKPEQALYEIAPLPGNENKSGAVITLSPYVPLTKYELAKDADESAFQTTASRIVNDLTALVNANPAAIAQ